MDLNYWHDVISGPNRIKLTGLSPEQPMPGFMLTRTTKDSWPKELEKLLELVNNYPLHTRRIIMLSELCEDLIKFEGLYIPLVNYKAVITYEPEKSKKASVMFKRGINKTGLYSSIDVKILSEKEVKYIGIINRLGAKSKQYWKKYGHYESARKMFDDFFRIHPDMLITSETDKDGDYRLIYHRLMS